MFIKNKAKITSKMHCVKWTGVNFSEMLFESNEEKFSFWSVKSQKVGRHPERYSLKSILEVGDAGDKVRWVKGKKKLCIVSIKVMVRERWNESTEWGPVHDE